MARLDSLKFRKTSNPRHLNVDRFRIITRGAIHYIALDHQVTEEFRSKG